MTTRALVALAAMITLTACEPASEEGWRPISVDIYAKCDGPNMVYRFRGTQALFVVANDTRCKP